MPEPARPSRIALPWLTRVVCAAALLLAGNVGAQTADIEADDQIRLLYSNQFGFTQDHLPLVTIGLMQGQREIILHGEDVHVLPMGESGPEVRAHAPEWRVTVESGRPARIVRHVVVGKVPFSEREQLAALVAEWRKRGFSPRTFETGALFGIAGQVLDRRRILIAVTPKTEAGKKNGDGTRELADRISSDFHVETAFYDELVAPPTGTVVARSPSGVEIRNPGVLWFAPANRQARIGARQVSFGYGSAKEQREDRTYFGKLYVAIDRQGLLALVNAVSEDKLLAGLVPAEMLPTAPPEALKAQSVAARTELLAKIGHRHFGDPFRLCATQHCQVYAGAGREHARTTQAVTETRGQVLFMGSSTELVDTYYSSTCGGYTEANENVWADLTPSPALRTQADGPPGELASFGDKLAGKDVMRFLEAPPAAYCKKSKMYRWRIRKSAAELAASLEPLGVGAVREISVAERGSSGRAKAVRIVGTGNKKESLLKGELKIRQLLGGLPSSLFVPTAVPAGGVTPDAFEFSGAGFGHGVGMCQYGAMGMAEQGKNFRDILLHYYRGATIKALY